MRAAVCRQYGPPEVVAIEEIAVPHPEPGMVVIEVQAAAVNFADSLLIANEYQVPMPLPFTPGSELAGVITQCGEGADSFSVGDRVYGSAFAGGFAEFAVLPAAVLHPMADSSTFLEAAAFGVAHATAYHALRTVAKIKPKEWVVVLGAGGGVGMAGVELASLLGGRVIAAASSEEKLAAAVAQGAEATINYETEDLKTRIKEITDGGADIVLDPVGGDYSEAALRATRFGGRFVVLGFAAGAIPRIPLNLVLLKGMTIVGLDIFSFARNDPESAARDNSELHELFATGQIHPVVSQRFTLDQTIAALRVVADRQAIGKVIVEPQL